MCVCVSVCVSGGGVDYWSQLDSSAEVIVRSDSQTRTRAETETVDGAET